MVTRGLKSVIAVVFATFVVSAQSAKESSEEARLIAAGKLWATVRYFHPTIDRTGPAEWDAAFLRSVAKIRYAANREEFAYRVVVRPERYRGKTVILIDDRAQSQSEATAQLLQAANGTVLIGTPSAGANGDGSALAIPGGIYIWFSGQGVRLRDGGRLQRVGLQPNVVVEPTVDGVRAGRDEVLEAALEYLGNPASEN